MSDTVSILVVDDDDAVRDSAAEWLSLSGFKTKTAANGEMALAILNDVDLVLTDMRMPGMSGLDLLYAARKQAPDVSVVVMTGHGDVPLAVEAMRAGAEDFIEKPCPADALVERIRRIAERANLRRDLARMKRQLDGMTGLERRWPGSSALAAETRRNLSALAGVRVPVLICGPEGSGKATAANILHELSAKDGSPFATFDSASAIQDATLQLFGGATYASPDGLLRDCEGGTLVLRDPELLPEVVQARLARAMREATIIPDGASLPIRIDVRIIVTTTNPDALQPSIRDATRNAQIALTSLHDRPSDIIPLYLHLVDEVAREHARPVPTIDAGVLAAILSTQWATDLPSLKADARARVLGLASDYRPSASASLADLVRDFERRLIERALSDHGGNQSAAARALQLPRRTLGEKISKLGVRLTGDT